LAQNFSAFYRKNWQISENNLNVCEKAAVQKIFCCKFKGLSIIYSYNRTIVYGQLN